MDEITEGMTTIRSVYVYVMKQQKGKRKESYYVH